VENKPTTATAANKDFFIYFVLMQN